MDSKPVPFKRTLFVCTHSREGSDRPSCAAPGRQGLELLEALKAEVKERGLKGKVRVSRSGCLDLCEQGPNAFLFPEAKWFNGLSAADAPRLADALAEGL